MKKRLVYAIGTTASKAIGELKSISLDDFNDETIYRSWDTDSGTKSRNLGLGDNEVVNLPEHDLRGTVKKIINERNVNEGQRKLYDNINKFFPIDNDAKVNKLPILNGQGAGKNPMASRLIGTLNRGSISSEIKRDVLDVAQSGELEAYVIMSPCGGTSTGLSVEVIDALAKENSTVYLFCITPNYFINVDKNSPDFYAKTPATLLRLIYDCTIQQNSVSGDPLKLYPFIIESRWTQHRFAEYNPVDEDKIDEEAFIKYLSYSLYAFFEDKRKPQSFFSNRVNHTEIAIPDKYLNMLLVYPNNQTKTKIVKEIQKIFEERTTILGTNETVSENKVEQLLKEILGGNSINLSHIILNKPDFVKTKLQKWKDDKTFKSIIELKEVLELIVGVINKEQNRLAEIKPQKKNDSDAFNDQLNKKEKHWFRKFLDFILGSDDGEGEVEKQEIKTIKDPEKVYALDNWCDTLLGNYKKNKDKLFKESKKVNIFNDYKPNNEDEILKENDVEALKKSLFNTFDKGDIVIQNIIDELFTKQQKEETYSDFAQPYALDGWGTTDYQKARKKEGEVTIEGLNYHYRMIANIPPEALSYLRDEYIKEYLNEDDWRYPDKRLEYRINSNATSRSFHSWHDEMIKKLNPSGIQQFNEKKTKKERREKLGAIAIIGAYLKVKKYTFNPLFSLNFDKNTNQYFLKFTKNGNTVESKKDIDFDDIVDDLINLLTGKNDNEFSVKRKETLNLDQLLEEAENDIFSLGKGDIDLIDEVMQKVGKFLSDYKMDYTESNLGNNKNVGFLEDISYYVKGTIKKIQRNNPNQNKSFPDLI